MRLPIKIGGVFPGCRDGEEDDGRVRLVGRRGVRFGACAGRRLCHHAVNCLVERVRATACTNKAWQPGNLVRGGGGGSGCRWCRWCTQETDAA